MSRPAPTRRRPRRQMNLRLLAAIAVTATVYVVVLSFIDVRPGQGLVPDEPGDYRLMVNALARASVTLISTVFACLFLAIPLTANMYTPQLIEIFVKSRTNRCVIGLFVFSAGNAIWLSRVPGGPPFAEVHAVFSLFLVLATLVILIPYLFSVFRLLDPISIIDRVRETLLDAMKPSRTHPDRRRHERLRRRIHDLGNIILRMLDRSDRDVALAAVEALDACATRYLAIKPQYDEAWFEVDASHFPGRSRSAIQLVNRDRTWVEMELLLQLNRAFGSALARVPDVITAIGRTQRHFAVAAAKRKDRGALSLALRYFNNFLREAVKRRDLHAVYDLLYQIREMAPQVWETHPEEVVTIGRRLEYYGVAAERAGMVFAHELIAYDYGWVVSRLTTPSETFDSAVDAFLAIHRQSPEDGAPELTAGMLKARVITAAELYDRGRDEAAKRVEHSLRGLPAALLEQARRDLLDSPPEHFWEVTDRQQNLDFTPPPVRAHVVEILARLEP